MKKILVCVLTVAILMSTISVGIYAYNLSLTTTRISIGNDSFLVSNAALEEAVEITADEAIEISKLFVSDMIQTPDCEWDQNTAILDVVPMYDETGVNITAYTIELNKGYVVVSAYSDAESLIPEWSDKAAPLYRNFDEEVEGDIVYLGSFEYFINTDTTSVVDLDGNNIEKNKLINYVEESRSIDNVPTALLENCVVRGGNVSVMNNGAQSTVNDGTEDGGYIINPHQHASATYGGTFTTREWYNEWGEYIDGTYDIFYITKQGLHLNPIRYYMNCAPTAITNIIKSYEKRYPTKCELPENMNDIFVRVAEYGLTHGIEIDNQFIYYYNSKYGSSRNTIPYYVYDCLNLYNIPSNVMGRYITEFDQLKRHLEEGCLLVLETINHDLYKNHMVMCFAYTRLQSETTGNFKTYLKVADGVSILARYIDLATVDADFSNDVSIHTYTKVGLW